LAPVSVLVVLLGLLAPLAGAAPAALGQGAAAEYPLSINQGTCAEPAGEPAFLAGSAAPPADQAPGGEPFLTAEETVNTTLDDLLRGGQTYALVVHADPAAFGTVVACGEIVGSVVGGQLVFGLRPVGGSGVAGVAVLDRDEQGFLGLGGQEVRLSVYLLGGLGAATPGVTTAPAASPAAAEPAATPPAAAATPVTGAVAVEIKDFAFLPATIAITTGTTVTWTNNDAVAHTATADDGSFNSGNLDPGQRFSFTFDRPGTYAYICSYHPFMKGTITVTGDPVAPGAATPPVATSTAPATVTPAATPVASTGIGVVARGLHAPRGMAWGADGTLYVVQSGTGDTATSTGAAAAVVRLDDGGCPVPVAAGLPSTDDPYKDVMGPQDIAELDGTLYVLLATTGPLEEMDPQTPNGVYAVEADGSFRLVADLTRWILDNPTAFTPGDANPRGEPYRMLPGDGFLWVLESNRGEVLRVGLDGQISRVADLSVGHPVLAGFALAPDGGVYVGTLTAAPHADGAAKVMKVTADGQVSDVWVNLTTVTGVAVGPDGALYALEMATGNSPEGGMSPGTGRLVRQTGADQAALVAINLDYPVALRIGPDGMAYVAFPAYGDNDQAGMVARIDLSAPRPMALDAAQLAAPACAAATPYAPPGPGAATPVPFPIATPG